MFGNGFYVREDIKSYTYSLRSNISINISIDTLTLSKQKETWTAYIYSTGGIMDIVAGNGHCVASSNPGQSCLYFT